MPNPPSQPTSPPPDYSGRRARPRLTEQIQIIRELWLLREQARVQAAERCFLSELEHLLSGRPYGIDVANAVPPPPPPPHHDPIVFTPAPEPPPLPPYSPSSPPTAFSAVSLLDDGMVFESNPPPRGAGSPVRERPNSVSQEMAQMRSQQRVTNLSAQFRARLEGNEPSGELRAVTRSRSFGELVGQRNVSAALDSAFRHRLEAVLTRRDVVTGRHLRRLYGNRMQAGREIEMEMDGRADEVERFAQGQVSEEGFVQGDGDRAALEAVVAALREEVSVLKNVVGASFDLQLDIQRSIRQEVAAAMTAPARLSLGPERQEMMETSACTTVDVDSSGDRDGSGSGIGNSNSSSSSSGRGSNSDGSLNARNDKAMSRMGAVKAGRCTICLENSVDALLYGCGHMCTCSMCGRQLLATGQSCPICRAPVRDVVRAFVVTE